MTTKAEAYTCSASSPRSQGWAEKDSDEIVEARVAGEYRGNHFKLLERRAAGDLSGWDYDPRYDLTAGELREAGKDLPASIPDQAWVPRWALRMGSVKVGPECGPRGVSVSWRLLFAAPFRW
jgi:hypothetical protein